MIDTNCSSPYVLGFVIREYAAGLLRVRGLNWVVSVAIHRKVLTISCENSHKIFEKRVPFKAIGSKPLTEVIEQFIGEAITALEGE